MTVSIAVYADWDGLPAPIRLGMLRARPGTGREVVEFEFDAAALALPALAGLRIDPRLGLFEGRQHCCQPRHSALFVRVLDTPVRGVGRPRTSTTASRVDPDRVASKRRRQQIYDHRLVLLVQQTGDATIATRLGVPRSTVAGWLARAPRAVTTDAITAAAHAELRARVARLEKRNELLRAVLRIQFALLRILKPDLSRLRVPAPEKARLLGAIHRTQGVLGLRRVLGLVGLSASRLRAWRRAEQGCLLDDQSSCPKSSPTRLTVTEVSAVREMVTSPDMRHDVTGLDLEPPPR